MSQAVSPISYRAAITSSNHRLESAGLNALEELLFKMLGMGREDRNACIINVYEVLQGHRDHNNCPRITWDPAHPNNKKTNLHIPKKSKLDPHKAYLRGSNKN